MARALIKNPKILILDEATSNLDFISEERIYKTLFSLDCTVVIVAHRLSTIRRCDNIVVIDCNRVIEQGKHEELLEEQGVYNKIWTSQIGEKIEHATISAIKKPKKNKTKNESIDIDSGDEITYI